MQTELGLRTPADFLDSYLRVHLGIGLGQYETA